MQDRSSSPLPLLNLIGFLVLSFAILLGYSALMAYLNPRPPQQAANPAEQVKQPEKAESKPPQKAAQPAKPQEKPQPKAAEGEKPAPKPPVEPQAKVPRQWVALGSADPQDPYRMLVTLSNQGAAMARVELSSDRYRDIEDRTGYLGHLVMEDDSTGEGALVQVVGPGTPAAKAGLKVGDRVTAVGDTKVSDGTEMEKALNRAKPGKSVELTVLRDGKSQPFTVALIRRPLEIVRPETKAPRQFATSQRHFDAIHPEDNVPLSMLTTLQQVDEEKIPLEDDPADVNLDQELKGVNLRTANWKVVEADQEHAVFRVAVPNRGLEVTKTYRLAKVPEDQLKDANARAYHLEFDVEIRNVGDKDRKVAYRLDGPNSLPAEGAWYASKVGWTWGTAGLRDVVFQFARGSATMVTCTELADKGNRPLGEDQPFRFLGVDAQYFSAVLMPNEDSAGAIERATGLRLGTVPTERKTLTNTSFRFLSTASTLAPGKSLTNHFVLFTGPKKPPLLAQYDLGNLIYYGWYGWVAKPMSDTLHFFYYLVRNYGVAIILLTVLVRLCMFPMSRKQALGAQKMQELQPEIKKIQEKYKKDVEGRTRAQQELFRKHNYNPLAGCLVLFVQFPIFIGLYRSLQVDVELRDASLLGHVVRWCSNLAAPDMLYDWSWLMPEWVNHGVGMLGLGPYFNLLPLFTIALFIAQQKMFMPPPADEQAALQQKMMNFMMIFMGILFYKVASGLCIYFIASSLWGMGERRFLPKKAPMAGNEPAALRPSRPIDSGRDGATARKSKKRGRR